MGGWPPKSHADNSVAGCGRFAGGSRDIAGSRRSPARIFKKEAENEVSVKIELLENAPKPAGSCKGLVSKKSAMIALRLRPSVQWRHAEFITNATSAKPKCSDSVSSPLQFGERLAFPR